jgi:hypothetical protein
VKSKEERSKSFMAKYKLPDNWDALPIKDATMGGVKKRIKVDNENGYIYLLDENGDWTGEKCKKPGDPPNQEKKPKEEEPKEAPGATQDTAGSSQNAAASQDVPEQAKEQDGEQPAKKKKKRRKSVLTPILLAVIAVLAVLLVLQNAGDVMPEKTYSVIVALENIQPGDPIEGKLAATTISATEFSQYSSKGGLYHPDEYDYIKSYVATEFIPADSCITYANVGEEFQASNPWMQDVGYTITIPIYADVTNLQDFIWVNNLYIELQVEHAVGLEDWPDADRPYTPDAEGSSKLKIVQVDNYTMNSFTIVDVLNDKKQSLYDTYAAFTAIPELYQDECLASRYTSEEEIIADTPAYIKIEVNEATIKWWETITKTKNKSITVSVYVVGSGCDNQLQNDTHLKIKAIIPDVVYAWNNAVFE